ncbi:DUF190 domain-containing protein, partial [Niveibacterium sp.]|uniref:DUF190 domain-containing protein n=1 Tax=Niveibacterium sp. TaxID=2017444 RepID=UPI0035B39B56
MQGVLLNFYTEQNRKHHGRPLAEWLLDEARRLGVSGATLLHAAEGFGRAGRLHAAHFFELADQPVEVSMAVSPEDADRMMARVREEGIKLFYMRIPVEFGSTAD